jgi:hypothetical protein
MAAEQTIFDDSGRSALPAEALAKLAAKSAEVGARHTPGNGDGGKPRIGRPPGSKTVNRAPAAGQAPRAGPSEDQAPPPPIDRKFIEEAAKTALTALDGIITRKVYNSTCALWPGNPSLMEEAKKFEESIALTGSEIKLFSDTMGAIAEKYPRLFGYAPELTMGIFMLGYGARVVSTFGEIKKLSVNVAAFRSSHGTPAEPAPAAEPSVTSQQAGERAASP